MTPLRHISHTRTARLRGQASVASFRSGLAS
jgi:hypothetical protein